MAENVNACFIVDDTPINATYWRRVQQAAFGFEANESGWATKWPSMASAAFWPVSAAHAFADFVEAFGIRGKFTFLPRPAGFGRIDQSIRGISDNDLQALIAIARDRIAQSMDITPEVLTHTFACDIETGALLPHTETAWLSHLCNTDQRDALRAYVGHAYEILQNVGFTPRGITVGGMEDLSGIAEGQTLHTCNGRDVLAVVLSEVEQQADAQRKVSFIYTGSPPICQASRTRRVPEALYQSADGGKVFAIHSMAEDPLYPVLLGQTDRIDATTDGLVAPDLASGLWIDQAEAGRIVCFTVHAQTMMAMNTGAGFTIIREAVRRLGERYGERLVWHTPTELCAQFGVSTF